MHPYLPPGRTPKKNSTPRVLRRAGRRALRRKEMEMEEMEMEMEEMV